MFKKSIEDLEILVVGDIMLDHYLEGSVDRISPEAPVPIVHIKQEYSMLGGCGNVVRNLRELGTHVDCLSHIGLDESGEKVKDHLNTLGVKFNLLEDNTKRTTVKQRIISKEHGTQLLRIDYENTSYVDTQKSINFLNRYFKKDYDIIIVSDYTKGMITKDLISALKKRNVRIIVDPKPKHTLVYDGVYMITPNEKEWSDMININPNIKTDYILNTLGGKGMKLINTKTEEVNIIKSEPVKVFNVSGCGDVVVAVMAACLSVGHTPFISAKIANACAGWTAALPGTSVILKETFEQIKNYVLLKN